MTSPRRSNPDSVGSNIILGIFLTVVMLSLTILLAWVHRISYSTRCDQAGGHILKSHELVICVDDDGAVVDVGW